MQDDDDDAVQDTSMLRQCINDAKEDNKPTREIKVYAGEEIPPLEIFLIDRPPPNTRAKWMIRKELTLHTGPHSARYVEGLKFEDDVLKC